MFQGQRRRPGAVDEIVVRGIRKPVPNSISDDGRAPMLAEFQYRAPAESSGAAVAAPPIDRLIGPTPLTARPNCAWAELVPRTVTRMHKASPNRK